MSQRYKQTGQGEYVTEGVWVKYSVIDAHKTFKSNLNKGGGRRRLLRMRNSSAVTAGLLSAPTAAESSVTGRDSWQHPLLAEGDNRVHGSPKHQ